MSNLDYTALKNALSTLKEALVAAEQEPDNALYRDACIQRFEYSYELSWKMLRRYLCDTHASAEEVKAMAFKDMIRLAAEKGLLKEPKAWFLFREKRNITSHTYHEAKAKDVYEVIAPFYQHAITLLHKLED